MIEKAGALIAKKMHNGEWSALLVQQKNSMLWSIPKGSQTSPKESWQKCARRELAEETGLFIEIQKDIPCELISGVAFFMFEPSNTQIQSFRNLRTKDPEEIHQVAWKSLNTIPDDCCNSILKKIKALLCTFSKSFHSLDIVKQQKIISVCTRSKWIPTTLFSSKGSCECSSNWR